MDSLTDVAFLAFSAWSYCTYFAQPRAAAVQFFCAQERIGLNSQTTDSSLLNKTLSEQ